MKLTKQELSERLNSKPIRKFEFGGSMEDEEYIDDIPFNTFKVAYGSPGFAKKYEDNLTFGTAKEGYEKLYSAEKERVSRARGRVLNVAEKAVQDPAYREKVLNHDISYISGFVYYCTARSCEIERKAGYTLPRDTTVNNFNYRAGSRVPIIPGSRQFASLADTLGYKEVSSPQAGDRIIKTWDKNPSIARHSQIYAGTDLNNISRVYDDSGSGDNFRKREYPFDLDHDLFYRYVGNTDYYKESSRKHLNTPISKMKSIPAKPIKNFKIENDREELNEHIKLRRLKLELTRQHQKKRKRFI